jgi:hypothetical protein
VRAGNHQLREETRHEALQHEVRVHQPARGEILDHEQHAADGRVERGTDPARHAARHEVRQQVLDVPSSEHAEVLHGEHDVRRDHRADVHHRSLQADGRARGDDQAHPERFHHEGLQRKRPLHVAPIEKRLGFGDARARGLRRVVHGDERGDRAEH